MAEILSGTTTAGLIQKLITYTSSSVNSSNIQVPFYAFLSGSKFDNNYTSNIVAKTILPIPSTQNNSPTSITAYYLMRAYRQSVGYVYWEATGGIDITAQESGVNPALLSFITFLGSRAV